MTASQPRRLPLVKRGLKFGH